jgi:4-hydroxy-2-oxoheptanedioate aldolase
MPDVLSGSDKEFGHLADRWRRGEATYGAWCSIPSSFSAEILSRVGFDWACIDLQHGMIGADVVLPMAQAFSITSTPLFIRVPWNDPASIMRALDFGAVGVIIPMIDTPAQAESAARSCRYPPLGFRSYGPTRAGLLDAAYSPARANQNVLCVVMVETREAIANLEAILSVEGVDAVFVGPADLAVSFGVDPAGNEQITELVAQVASQCREHRRVAGIFCPTLDAAVAWRAFGYQLLALQSDVRLLRNAAAAALATVHGQNKPSIDGPDSGSTGYI